MSTFFKKAISLGVSVLMIGSIFTGCASSENKTEEKNTAVSKTVTEEISDLKFEDTSYMVDANWLSKNLESENLVILDARSEKAFSNGHLPGAINVKWQQFSNMNGSPGDEKWGTVLDSEKLSSALSEVGIKKDSNVVVYADCQNGWGEDGRIVWMLRMAGISNSSILDGGFSFWKESNMEVSKEKSEIVKSELKVENMDLKTSINTEELKAQINDFVIIDTREKAEFDGATKFGEQRGGHIPNSKHLVFNDLLNENGTLKSASEIQSIFDSLNLKKDDKIVTYCTAGIRSAHMQVIMSMMGYKNVKNYDESFYRWAAVEELKLEK